MAERVLARFGKLRERCVFARLVEDRIVREPELAALVARQLALRETFRKDLATARVDVAQHAHESRAAVLRAAGRNFTQNRRTPLRPRRVLATVARRIDAGPAAERGDLEPRVVR